MLEITKRINLKGATDAATGDVQVYLEQLLVEVIAANYRQFLSEKTERTRNGLENSEYSCWPPLFANERQVSGIFSSSLNTMCPSTLAEHKIHRDLERNEDENELMGKAGRVDFMSSYSNRYIGLELKRVSVGVTAAGDYTVLQNKWAEVTKQSKEAHTFMRQKEFRSSYPNGTGVGLMVVRVAKQVSSNWDIPTEIERLGVETDSMPMEIEKLLKPDFFATYTPPAEMQAVSGFGKNSEAFKIFPKILFAAVVHGRAESLKS
jgi:hypothetical protein